MFNSRSTLFYVFLILLYSEIDRANCEGVPTSKSIPITGISGPEGSGRVRIPDSMTSALKGGRLSALCTGRLYPQEYSGTHFLRG
jgi:hypothetical protein